MTTLSERSLFKSVILDAVVTSGVVFDSYLFKEVDRKPSGGGVWGVATNYHGDNSVTVYGAALKQQATRSMERKF